jgi:hypothetical protein
MKSRVPGDGGAVPGENDDRKKQLRISPLRGASVEMTNSEAIKNSEE